MEEQKKTTLKQRVKKNAIGLVVLVSLLLCWVFILAPQLTKMDSQFNLELELISIDNFFSEEKGEYIGEQYTEGIISYEVLGTTGSVSTIKNNFSIFLNEEQLVSIDRVYGINRYTGGHIAEQGDKEREGYLFAPKYLQQGEEFQYWHVNYDGPGQMEFVEETWIQGLEVYLYKTMYEGVDIDQTEVLGHLPLVGEERGIRLEPQLEIWIEPTSGQLIKFHDETIAYFYDLESGENIVPWNKFSNTVTQNSVTELVQQAQRTRNVILFSDFIIPLLLVLGMLMMIISTVMTKRRLELGVPIMYGTMTLMGVLLLIDNFYPFIGSLVDVEYYNWVNPVTAILVVCIGLASILRRGKGVRVAKVLLLSVISILTIKALNEAGVIEFAIDQVFERFVVGDSEVLSSLSIFTLVGLCLLTIGLLIEVTKSSSLEWLRQILPGIIITLCLLSFGAHIVLGEGINGIMILESASIPTITILCIFAILQYVEIGQQEKLSTKSWLTLTSIIGFVFILVISLVSLVEWNFRSIALGNFETAITETVERTHERAGTYVIALEGGRGLLRASDQVDRAEWATYTSALELDVNYPGIQGFGYSIFVSDEEKETHEESIHEEGYPEYKIKPEGERDPYSTIIFLEPFDERNRQAFGFDMYSEQLRRAAMDAALESGDAVLSGKITLVQEIDEDVQPGFLIYVPYYGNGEQPENQDERIQDIVGFVYAPFRATNFFEGIIGEAGIPGIAMEVYDGPLMTEEQLLYSDVEEKIGESTPRFEEVVALNIVGRPWTFRFTSNQFYGPQITELYWVIGSMLMGVIMGTLLIYAFYVNIMSEQRARTYANKQTEKLKKTQVRLTKQVEDMERTNNLMINREKRIKELKEKVSKK